MEIGELFTGLKGVQKTVQPKRPINSTLGSLCTGLALAWLAALPNQALAATAEVAILKSAELASYNEAVQGFKAMLPSQIEVTEYNLKGSLSTGQEIARMLRADPPTLVFAVGLKAALSVKLELPDTPVVFAQVLDPESHQLPTERMTGIRVMVSPDQQLSTLRALLPHAQRVGVFYNGEDRKDFLTKATKAAHRLKLTLVTVRVSSVSDVFDALKTLLPTIDALWLIQDRTILTEESVPILLNSVLDAKRPIFTFSESMIRQGALGGLVLAPRQAGRQAGEQAVHLLRGNYQVLGKLLDPDRPQLALNVRVAEYLGITPPAELVQASAILYGLGMVAQHSSSKHAPD